MDSVTAVNEGEAAAGGMPALPGEGNNTSANFVLVVMRLPTNAQRDANLAHLKLSMRKVSLAILTATVLLVILTNWSAVSASTGRVADRLLLYVRVVRLYAEEPDPKLALPLHDVKKNQIADTWHAPRGTDRLHEGQDIFAPKGTPIYSATNGYVYNVGENGLGGQTVSVIGAGGRVYYYAHLDSYAEGVAVGDYVTTKSVLGYVGSTGNAAGTPPHLHFGVYTSTGAINPLPLLADQTELSNRKPKNVNTSAQKPPAKKRRTHD